MYNCIPELIIPNSQSVMIHYNYNTFPPILWNGIEEKGVNDISIALQNFLDYAEKALRTSFPLTNSSKNVEMIVVL